MYNVLNVLQFYLLIAPDPYRGEVLQHLDDYTNMPKAQIEVGTYFDTYQNIPVKVTGMDNETKEIKEIPQEEYRIDEFEKMGFEPQLLENVKAYGYKIPTPVQKR